MNVEKGHCSRAPKTFKDLGVCNQLSGACRRLGWHKPTEIQAGCIPHALAGKDLIGIALSGSGKTGAFVLPILQNFLSESPDPFAACIISFTKELAIKTTEQFQKLGEGTDIDCVMLVGAEPITEQVNSLERKPHIVASVWHNYDTSAVATPGRLMTHLFSKRSLSFNALKYLVFDEVDLLMECDSKEVEKILSVVPKELRLRTYFFCSEKTKEVKLLAEACLKDPVEIKLTLD